MSNIDHLSDRIAGLLIAEFRRRVFEENIPRLKKCLGLLTEEEVWWRPNEHSNSVGNLVLHLCGNAQQYVVSGIGGVPDTRKRQAEFDERGPIPIAELLQRLDALQVDLEKVLDQLKPAHLAEERRVQGFSENVTSILVHVVEHFSYHTGQVTYYVKYRKDLDTGYYAGLDLDVTN